jgi:phospholipid transport system substrate-binding protein
VQLGRRSGRRPGDGTAWWRLMAAAAVWAACTGAGVTPTPGAGPTAAVRAVLAKAAQVAVSDASRDQNLAALRALARELVDTRAMGRRALGDRFDRCTKAQQDEFLDLFDELIVRSYLQKLLLFRTPKFRFGKEEPHGESVTVDTDVVTSKDAYQVSYEMERRDGRWLATDIVVEGVSMTSNYADQFASLLRDRSFDELLDLMRRKVEHFRSKDHP